MTRDGDADGVAPEPGGPASPLLAIGRKDFVTTSLGPARLWATAAQGILTEVYWPTTGDPQIRDLGFIVAGDGWWLEVKRERNYTVEIDDPRVPLARVRHRGPASHPYQLVLTVVPDPRRDVLMIEYSLTELEGARLYPMLAARLARGHGRGAGLGNEAWSESGRLFAGYEGRSLCLAADAGFDRTSVGYFGSSDLWQDFARNGAMTWEYRQAGPGCVVLGGQLTASTGVLMLSFSDDQRRVSALVDESLRAGVAATRSALADQWLEWAATTRLPDPQPNDPPELPAALHLSATVIKTHQDRSGAIMAGLCVPWGDSSNDPGGYHLVWPRDAVEGAWALLALGHGDDARQLLSYLAGHQNPDGGWPQNFFPDGTGYWTGTQLDEIGLPVLLGAALEAAGYPLEPAIVASIRLAIGYLVRCGPGTGQDRWEEEVGASPYTLATLIAALVVGTRYLDDQAERDLALSLADSWQDHIEDWTCVTDSLLDHIFGLRGHYIRVGQARGGRIHIKNRIGDFRVNTAAVLGMEFCYLARLGLRPAGSPFITDTLRLVEALLGRDIGRGISYYRYNFDGYGELIDGRNFDGSHGLGRLWPLLTGERGHLAVAAGEDSTQYLNWMLNLRSKTGLVPEQVWDQPPLLPDPETLVPAAPLLTGYPTLSATPLVWGHSELVKLAFARAAGTPLECFPAVVDRYRTRPTITLDHWRAEFPFPRLRADRTLMVEAREPFGLEFGPPGGPYARREAVTAPLGLFAVTITPEDRKGWDRLELRRDGTKYVLVVQPES